MNRIARPTCITNALFSVLLLAGASAVAGEVREPTPTAPTLYYACMSTGGRTEYDSAAFASKNPGPDYKDHYNLNVKMMAAFDAYLTQKYGFHGLVNCGRHNTLAEAKQWLQWRESESRAPGKNYEYFATDWTYDGAAGESAAPAAATPPAAATTQAGQPPGAAAGVPTASFICIATSQGTAYESAIFEASNDAGTARRIQFTFAAYLSEKYKIGAMPVCRSKPTRAAVEAHMKEFPAGVQGGVSQHISTGWVYNAAPGAAAQPASASVPVASAPSAAEPVVPAPAAPQAASPQPVAAAIKPATPAPAAAPGGVFVVCWADTDPTTRYYNPPVDGGDGNYGTWMPSYQSFMQQKHRYQRAVRCNKQPTLAEAQAYYQTTLDQARLQPSINGVPSPIVVTDWKYK